jgi:catechol 2,3-dioxygenase-like lactoylglutathione lyase family enzyme
MSEKKQEEKYSNPKFESAVFFVQDVDRSKEFYTNILGQKITMNLGRNVVFEGGLAIWEANYALNTIFSDKAKNVKVGGNNVEIYFESSNLEEVYQKLENNNVKLLNPITEAPWGQKTFRVYDPDNNIIEFGEPMPAVVIRLHQKGMSPEEITKKTKMPIEIVNKILENI